MIVSGVNLILESFKERVTCYILYFVAVQHGGVKVQ